MERVYEVPLFKYYHSLESCVTFFLLAAHIEKLIWAQE